MRQVGRYLGAAEQNQRVREQQVARRAAGPAGPRSGRGPLQSRRDRNGTTIVYDRNGRVKSFDELLDAWNAIDWDEIDEKTIGNQMGTVNSRESGTTGGGAGPAGRDVTQMRDGNNNGRIFDGTKYEMPAPKKSGADNQNTSWQRRADKHNQRLQARRDYLASRDTDSGPKSTQANQRNERLDRAVAREQIRGWEPTSDGRGLRPAAGRRGAMGPVGPRNHRGAVSVKPGSQFSPATRAAEGENTRWAPGAADAPVARRGQMVRSGSSNVRTPHKSYDDPALTFDEVAELESKDEQ
jgi:hypothetical protein